MATSMPTVITTKTCQTTRENPPSLVLGLNRGSTSGPRVRWSEGTVDNEHLNKKKSKCCCIYTKPHDAHVDEDKNTTVDEFDNCQHCRYHTESDYAATPDERQPKVKISVGKPQ